MQLVENWGEFRNFDAKEFNCSYTRECKMSLSFLRQLQHIRDLYGKPIVITSGYRHETHPVERNKSRPGEHNYGLAVDIKVFGRDALELLSVALECGIMRVGVKQKGAPSSRFIHLGAGDKIDKDLFVPGIWSY